MAVIWELDFYSRPVLDENQKKRWEVLICESPLAIDRNTESLFRYSQFCSSTQVNSVWLRKALEEAIQQWNQSLPPQLTDAQLPQFPDKIRFFRRQMENMILKGCQDAGIPASASRRTLALHQWIQQRMVEVYPADPNYRASANPSVNMPAGAPQQLPDALMGQQWAFVTLEASSFADLPEWDIGFGEVFPLSLFDIAPDTPIPGVIIFSSRALPLAGWMSGLEMAFLRGSDAKTPQLILETGANDAWILANLPTPQLQAEMQQFETAKQRAQNVHFLAVQADPQSESFAGFWLMQDLNLG
jgi:RNA-binding protein Tab2/Atab2